MYHRKHQDMVYLQDTKNYKSEYVPQKTLGYDKYFCVCVEVMNFCNSLKIYLNLLIYKGYINRYLYILKLYQILIENYL